MPHRWILAALLAPAICLAQPEVAVAPGKDLRLTYFSRIDQTEQPYRVYVPSSYEGQRPIPCVIAMHGTGGNESSLFEDKRLPPGTLGRVAEKHGVLMVSPHGRGTTEYRGIGENDIFCVLAEVRKRYRIDGERIYLTGQSMGGTGAAYLGLHHPDLFAAVAPLAPAYSFPWLAANLQHVPSWWIQGAKDAGFYLVGAAVGIDRMRALGGPVKYDLIPDEEHPAGLKRIDDVVGWLKGHQRVAHPRDYVFEVDTPLHGRAYWTAVDAIATPGKVATVRAKAEGDRRVRLDLENVASLAFFPDAAVFDLAQPLAVVVNQAEVYAGMLPRDRQLRLVAAGRAWKTTVEPRQEQDLTTYRTHPVAVAPAALDNRGTESLLANWITDAMRDATGADIALYNRVHDRGLGIPQGTVDIVDLIQCSRPFDQCLVTTRLTGRELLEILDANAAEPKRPVSQAPAQPAARLIQISGARYRFDPSLPAGKRIVSSDLDPARRYTVVMEGQVVERETVLLAGRFKKLEYTSTNTAFTLALYGYAAKLKKIEARAEGRVQRDPIGKE
jgi:predicted esterase